MRFLLLIALLFTNFFTVYSQCSFNVDFNTWVVEGDPANGDWDVLGGGTSVIQRNNGDPSFFVSPQSFINVEMTGKMRTTDGDDDFMGVVFGYNKPVGNSTVFDTWMVDWKMETSGGNGGGKEGLSLVKIDGDVGGLYQEYFWNHTEDAVFEMVDSAYGPGMGWTRYTTHEIKVVYTLTKIIVIVDGDTIFNETGCYETGRFGFYNYSQEKVTYSDFDYKLKADFTLLTPQICVTDSLRVQSVCGIVPANIATWAWEFGDGGTSTAQNPSHKYANAGTYTIKLVQTDMLGCKDSVISTVVVKDLPQAVLSSSVAICVGDEDALVTFTGSNGEIPYTFYYKLDGVAQTAEISVGNSATLFVGSSSEDSFIYTLDSVVDINGCVQTETGTTTVEINTVPTVTITGTSALCEIAGTNDVTFAVSSGNAPYTFSYTDPLGVAQTIVSSTSSTIIAQSTLDAGIFNYSLTNISDVNSCGQNESDAIIITVHSVPTATLSGGNTVCKDGSFPNITFTANNGRAPYTFKYNIGVGSIPIIAPVASINLPHSTILPNTTSYNLLEVSDFNGCSRTQSQTETMIVLSSLTANLTSSDPDICEGEISTWSFVGGLGVAPYTFNYRIDSLNRGTSSTGNILASSSSTILASPNTYADTLVMTITGISDASGLSCPTATASFDSIIVNAIPTSIISASLGDVCENTGGTQTIIFDASANPSLPTPITFNYYYEVDGANRITGFKTSAVNSLIDSITYNVPDEVGQTIFYNQSVSSSACGGGVGGGSDTINVTPLPTATISAISGQIICDNSNSIVRLTGGTATAPYTFTYKINNSSTYSITTISGDFIDINLDTIPGFYTYYLLSVTDDLGCSPTPLSSSITFTVDALPTATTTVSQAVICEDATATVSGLATNGNINWTILEGPGSITENETTTTPTFEGAGTNTADITVLQMKVTSSNTCFPLAVTSTATITTEPLPKATANGYVTICEESVHTISGTSASNGTIMWQHTGYGILVDANTSYPTYAAVNLDTITPVIFTKTVTSDNSCDGAEAQATYTIGVDKLPAAYAGSPLTICENGTITIWDATYANGEIEWTLESGPGSIISGEETLRPYFKSGGAGTASATVLSMKVSSSNTCMNLYATSTTTITTESLPKAFIDIEYAVTCEDATASVAGSVTNANISWHVKSGPGFISENGATNTPTFTGGGEGTAATSTLMLTATSNNTCGNQKDSITATIKTEPLPLSEIVTNSTTICENATTNFVGGNATNGTIEWSIIDGPGNIIGSRSVNNPTFKGGGAESAGLTNLQMKVSSNNACAGAVLLKTATILTESLPIAIITSDDQTICESGITTVAGTALNGIPDWTLFSGPGSLAPSSEIAIYTASAKGYANLMFTVRSNNSCGNAYDRKSTNITMDPLPSAEITTRFTPDSTCSNVGFELGSTVKYATQVWSANGMGEILNPTAINPTYVPVAEDELHTIILFINATSNNACEGEIATDQFPLFIHALPSANVIEGLNQCEGEEEPIVTFVGEKTTGPYTFTFMRDEDIFTLPANGIYQKELYVNVPTNLAAIYTFSLQVVEDGNNCISDVITNNIDTVEVYRKPYADFMLDKKITSLYEPAFFIEETSIDATKWEWDFGDGTTSSLQYPDEHSYTDSGSFLITLKVSNPSGCKDSTTQIATVEKPTSVYIPSAFTPNGDGSNDTFLPKGDGIIEYSITIYNRWGMAIYKSNDITQGWDGTIDGSIPDAMDAYVYLIVVKDVKRHEHIYRGMINLIW